MNTDATSVTTPPLAVRVKKSSLICARSRGERQARRGRSVCAGCRAPTAAADAPLGTHPALSASAMRSASPPPARGGAPAPGRPYGAQREGRWRAEGSLPKCTSMPRHHAGQNSPPPPVRPPSRRPSAAHTRRRAPLSSSAQQPWCAALVRAAPRGRPARTRTRFPVRTCSVRSKACAGLALPRRRRRGAHVPATRTPGGTHATAAARGARIALCAPYGDARGARAPQRPRRPRAFSRAVPTRAA
jgi:hypothetical protein